MRLKGQLTKFQYTQLITPVKSTISMLEQIKKEKSNCYKLLVKVKNKLEENYFRNSKL